MTTRSQTGDRSGALPGGSPASRLLGFFGLAREAPATAPRADPGPPWAGRAADPDPAPQARPAKLPRILGEPIHQSEGADLLGSSQWTTQPRVTADGGTAGQLTVRAASVSGRRHARTGETREDAFAIRQTPDGTVVAAVADGVGAARYSAVGAQVASMMSCQLVCAGLENRWPIDARALCAHLGSQMMNVSRRFIGKEPDDRDRYDEAALATTLITVWVSAAGAYSGFMIGDGGVFELAAGNLSEVTPARGSTFSDTEALPSAYSQVEKFSGQLGRGSALLVATDGLSVPVHSPDVARVLALAWERPPTILDFLYDMSFERKGEWDDRTGVGIWFELDRAVR
jgi:serine/threonine protein phosphatase PrpC